MDKLPDGATLRLRGGVSVAWGSAKKFVSGVLTCWPPKRVRVA